MRRKILFFNILFTILIPVFVYCAEESLDRSIIETEFNYFIGPGDVLDIKLWRHADLDMEVTVRPDCRISYPIVNEINACDIPIESLRSEMTARLGTVIQNPQLAINVKEFQSQKILVLGEIERPGIYPFTGRQTVLEAITRAGGYKSSTAVMKSVMLLRKDPYGKTQAIKLDLIKAIKKADFQDNVDLRSGDVVFVPKSFIGDVNTFINLFASQTNPVLKTYIDLIQIDQRSIR